MDLDDLLTMKHPPTARIGKADDEHEHHFYEGAVMLAYAMHLLRVAPTMEVRIHPDGEHGKQFDFSGWLLRQGFEMMSSTGRTTYGGTYLDGAGRTIIVNPKSGLGDVVAEVEGRTLAAECKGGIINTKHAGQVSRLRRGLCETIGLLMSKPSPGRQVAVVPYTAGTLRMAQSLAPRCRHAGIEIALIKSRGEVIDVK